MSMSDTYRAILGVGHDANESEIRAAFRAAAKRAHPDQGGSNEAFQLVRTAADSLIEELRAGAKTQARPAPGDEDRISKDGPWQRVSYQLKAAWGLTGDPVTVYAPQRIGLTPFTDDMRLNLQAYRWLLQKVGSRGISWDFHVTGSVTRVFFRHRDDARRFQLKFH